MPQTARQRAALERLQKPLPARERLCALRELAGLGEKAFGVELAFGVPGDHVSGPTVHEWEHGTRTPGEANRKKIERWTIEAIRKLGVAVRPVFEGDWDAPPASELPEASPCP